MAGDLQPLDQKFPIVDQSGKPTLYFIEWAQQKQIDIQGAITAEQFNTLLLQYLLDHQLQEGSGIQITPSGNLSDSPTIAADVQEILDQITTTQGSIIFRNASDWVALAPGPAGQFLRTNGAGADPSWAAGGGGGSSYERARVPPLVAGFTLQNAGTASITNKLYGMEVNGPNVGSQIRFVRKNGAPPATPYTIILRGAPVNPQQVNGYFNSIILRNNTSGRILISGVYQNTNYLLQAWSSYAAFNSNVLAPVFCPFLNSTPWQKLENDGVNLRWYLSPDGDDWRLMVSTTLAAYINAAGGTVDEIGFGIMVNGQDVVMNAQSFEVV